MQAHELRPDHSKSRRKRVGRGNGSGIGTYSGKGMKGQKSRSGGGVRPGFEGGQNPLIKGLPMLRGFKNLFRKEYQVVNLNSLASLPEDVTQVNPEVLVKHGLVRNAKRLIKILGWGEISRSIEIMADKYSGSAKTKIEAAGGKAEVR